MPASRSAGAAEWRVPAATATAWAPGAGAIVRPPWICAGPGPGAANWSRKVAGAPSGSASGNTNPSIVAARPVAGSAPSAAVPPDIAGAAPLHAVTTGGPDGAGVGRSGDPDGAPAHVGA